MALSRTDRCVCIAIVTIASVTAYIIGYKQKMADTHVTFRDLTYTQSDITKVMLPENACNITDNISAKDLALTWAKIRHNFIKDLKHLLELKVTEDDPRLLALIQRNLFPPATHGSQKLSFALPPTNQAKTVMEYFKNKKTGFYVECGGFDGERSSNTLPLEKLGWQGLLIEADHRYFLQSLGKNRKAWHLNAGISPNNSTDILTFQDSRGGLGVLKEGGKEQVPCFPLNTIMAAMGRKRIDFFSLDVEGLEVKVLVLNRQPHRPPKPRMNIQVCWSWVGKKGSLLVLESVSYKSLDICTLTMEYNHNKEKPHEIIQFMATAGYKLHKKIDFVDIKISHFSHDLFFVRKEPCT